MKLTKTRRDSADSGAPVAKRGRRPLLNNTILRQKERDGDRHMALLFITALKGEGKHVTKSEAAGLCTHGEVI